MPNVKAHERLWLSKDRKSLVPDGHEDAAILFAAKGAEISEADALKFGLIEAPKAAEKEGDKAKPKAPNKSRASKDKKAKGLLVIDAFAKDK